VNDEELWENFKEALADEFATVIVRAGGLVKKGSFIEATFMGSIVLVAEDERREVSAQVSKVISAGAMTAFDESENLHPPDMTQPPSDTDAIRPKGLGDKP